jgi:predicted dehydrogenase
MIRVGLIGANPNYGWSPRAHIPAIQALPGFELAAVCTAHEDTAKESAEKFGVPLAFHDHHELLARPDIDLVTVSVRVPLHYKLTMDALAAKKPVFTEWPLGANLAEAAEMADLARVNKVHTMVDLQARCSPAFIRLKELIGEGYVGEVLSCHLDQLSSGVLTRTSDRTWQRDRTLGANTLTIAFGHAIDIFCYCVGDFQELSAVVDTRVPQWYESDTQKMVDVTSPDNVLVSGKLVNGAVASVHVANVPYHSSGLKIEVYGREGTLVLSMMPTAQLGFPILRGGRSGDKDLQELEIPDRLFALPENSSQEGVWGSASIAHVARMYQRFGEAIRTDERVEPDFDTALERHKLIAAIERSSWTGKRETLI